MVLCNPKVFAAAKQHDKCWVHRNQLGSMAVQQHLWDGKSSVLEHTWVSLCRFKKIIPIPEQSMVQTLCYLLECLLTKEDIPADCPKETYELYFVFAAIWAFGGAMVQDQVRGRAEVNTHVQVHSSKNWPTSKDLEDRMAKCQNQYESVELFVLPTALLKTSVPTEGLMGSDRWDWAVFWAVAFWVSECIPDFLENCSVWVWTTGAISIPHCKVICFLYVEWCRAVEAWVKGTPLAF